MTITPPKEEEKCDKQLSYPQVNALYELLKGIQGKGSEDNDDNPVGLYNTIQALEQKMQSVLSDQHDFQQFCKDKMGKSERMLNKLMNKLDGKNGRNEDRNESEVEFIDDELHRVDGEEMFIDQRTAKKKVMEILSDIEDGLKQSTARRRSSMSELNVGAKLRRLSNSRPVPVDNPIEPRDGPKEKVEKTSENEQNDVHQATSTTIKVVDRDNVSKQGGHPFFVRLLNEPPSSKDVEIEYARIVPLPQDELKVAENVVSDPLENKVDDVPQSVNGAGNIDEEEKQNVIKSQKSQSQPQEMKRKQSRQSNPGDLPSHSSANEPADFADDGASSSQKDMDFKTFHDRYTKRRRTTNELLGPTDKQMGISDNKKPAQSMIVSKQDLRCHKMMSLHAQGKVHRLLIRLDRECMLVHKAPVPYEQVRVISLDEDPAQSDLFVGSPPENRCIVIQANKGKILLEADSEAAKNSWLANLAVAMQNYGL